MDMDMVPFEFNASKSYFVQWPIDPFSLTIPRVDIVEATVFRPVSPDFWCETPSTLIKIPQTERVKSENTDDLHDEKILIVPTWVAPCNAATGAN